MRRRTLPLMEELVMTLVFALAAAICLRAFALADGISRRSALRDALLRQWQRAVERARAWTRED